MNLVPGSEVYGEKRISVETNGEKNEYRVWNPFRSKLAAAVLGGVDKIHMPPGSKVLYLGAASGTTVSHVSDVVGPEGLVYAVEFSHRSGRDLINVAKKRTNIIPIIEDARHPHKYRMLVGLVQCFPNFFRFRPLFDGEFHFRPPKHFFFICFTFDIYNVHNKRCFF